MTGSHPVRLQIPALGVDTGLLDLGLQDDRTLEVPPDGASVGWFIIVLADLVAPEAG